VIPRQRPNFTYRDLAAAAGLPDGDESYKTELRRALTSYLGAEDALLTPSGRSALYATLVALERPRVVVPAYTCNAVVEAALLAGKQVVYAEADDGFNSSASALADVTRKGDVVLATHQFGLPCEIERTVRIARAKGAMVVEDVAAALGTRIGSRLAGTFGDVAFFSFDMGKLVNVPVKGGAVIARSPALLGRIRAAYEREIEPMPAAVKRKLLAEAAALLAIQNPIAYRAFHRWRFGGETFTAESPTLDRTRTAHYQYDFTSWQALIALPQVRRLDAIVARRRALYAEYFSRLRGCRSFALPPKDAAGEWAPIRFPIRVHGDKLSFYREAARRGVDFAFSFTFIAAPSSFAIAHDLARSVLDLPFYVGLRPRELERTIRVLRAVDRSAS
jgi:dTDP-4-amino-4,6-dideoxygalactose transaminase